MENFNQDRNISWTVQTSLMTSAVFELTKARMSWNMLHRHAHNMHNMFFPKVPSNLILFWSLQADCNIVVLLKSPKYHWRASRKRNGRACLVEYCHILVTSSKLVMYYMFNWSGRWEMQIDLSIVWEYQPGLVGSCSDFAIVDCM